MWRQAEDTTFRDIREKSVLQWLLELSEHEDIAVRGGVKVTREYIEDLKKQIHILEEQNALKDNYLRKLNNNKKEQNSCLDNKKV